MEKQKHPWVHAATYIRAAFVEERDPTVVCTIERAARYLLTAVENGEAPVPIFQTTQPTTAEQCEHLKEQS